MFVAGLGCGFFVHEGFHETASKVFVKALSVSGSRRARAAAIKSNPEKNRAIGTCGFRADANKR